MRHPYSSRTVENQQMPSVALGCRWALPEINSSASVNANQSAENISSALSEDTKECKITSLLAPCSGHTGGPNRPNYLRSPTSLELSTADDKSRLSTYSIRGSNAEELSNRIARKHWFLLRLIDVGKPQS
eukprot:767590-Hanusia_phi.AAC.1